MPGKGGPWRNAMLGKGFAIGRKKGTKDRKVGGRKEGLEKTKGGGGSLKKGRRILPERGSQVRRGKRRKGLGKRRASTTEGRQTNI